MPEKRVDGAQISTYRAQIQRELVELDLLAEVSARNSSNSDILRDGFWPSESAFAAWERIQEAFSHGIQLPQDDLSTVKEAYAVARDALVAGQARIKSGKKADERLIGEMVGAILQARDAEPALLRLSGGLLRATAIVGGERKRGTKNRLRRFLMAPERIQLFPNQAEYRGLREGYLRLEALNQEGGWRGLSLAERFERLGWGNLSKTEDVAYFQAAHRLEKTGVIGESERKQLERTLSELVAQSRESLRRWHHSPIRGEKTYLRVNIPAFLAEYTRGEATRFHRVVVGDSEGETIEFSRNLRSIDLNPRWYVPQAVRQRDLDKRERKDPGFLKRNGFRKTHGGKSLVQSPGEHNWLGRVIFRWNRGGTESIYIHDSPFQERFGLRNRALSHGCVNMEGARSFAREIARDFGGLHPDAFDRLFRTGKTRKIQLRRRLPVFIEYTTVVPAGEGRLAFLEDIYDRARPAHEDEFAQR